VNRIATCNYVTTVLSCASLYLGVTSSVETESESRVRMNETGRLLTCHVCSLCRRSRVHETDISICLSICSHPSLPQPPCYQQHTHTVTHCDTLPDVWSWSRSHPESKAWSRSQRRVLLLDCTLSRVLHGFSQCTVLAGRAMSSVSWNPSTCTRLCTFC